MRISNSTAKWLGTAAAAATLVSFFLDFLMLTAFLKKTDHLRFKTSYFPEISSKLGRVTAIVFDSDPDRGDELNYFWRASWGRIQQDRFPGPKSTYIAPDKPGLDFITVTVYDHEGATDKDFTVVTIKEAEKVKSL